MQKKGTAYLDAGEVTIGERDIELLCGIDEHGSMHRAASELERSYAHMHKRIVELEETVGPLVERQRGGSGGGGSALTAAAKQILQQYERFCAELSGLAAVEESVFSGCIVDQDGELATIETEARPIRTLIPADVDTSIGIIQVGVRADMVTLTNPTDTLAHPETSVQN